MLCELHKSGSQDDGVWPGRDFQIPFPSLHLSFPLTDGGGWAISLLKAFLVLKTCTLTQHACALGYEHACVVYDLLRQHYLTQGISMYVQGNFWVYEPPPCMGCGQFYNQNETPNRWDVGRVLIVTMITVDASPNLPLSHLCLLNTSIGILSGYQCSSKQVYILVSNFKKSAPSPLVWPAVSVPSRPFEAGRTEADRSACRSLHSDAV